MRCTRGLALATLLVCSLTTVSVSPRNALAAVSAHHLSGSAAATHTPHHLSRVHIPASARAYHGGGIPRKGVVVPITAPMVQMLGLINAERAQAGAAPLAFDPTLNAIAQWRSQDMIARHYFSHQIPGLPGISLVFDVLDRDHVPYEMAGENIALNNYITYYPLAQTVQQTNTDFMNSPDHRANILEPKYSKVGLGLAFEQGTGKLIVTEIFVQP